MATSPRRIRPVHQDPQAGLTPRNLAEHCRRGHVAVKSQELKEIIAARAAENVAVLEVAVDRHASALKLASAVVKEAGQRLAAGEIEPSFQQAIAACRLLAEHDVVVLERDRLRDQLKRSQKDLAEVFRIAGELLTEGQWRQLGMRIQADPELRATWPPFWR